MKRKLIIYFSYTGHTRMIAERVKEKLNCDLLEIKTVQQYSSDYEKVVAEEQTSGTSDSLPEIEEVTLDLSSYEDIILGTPVWWYHSAPAIRTFLTQYDCSGKKIIPFVTNAGWAGSTFTEIKKLCPQATVEQGINILFDSDYTESHLLTPLEEIDRWIETL